MIHLIMEIKKEQENVIVLEKNLERNLKEKHQMKK